MEPRNRYLQDKLFQAQQAIEQKITELPISRALQDAKSKFISAKATEEQRCFYALTSLVPERPPYPKVKIGEEITDPLLDDSPAFV